MRWIALFAAFVSLLGSCAAGPAGDTVLVGRADYVGEAFQVTGSQLERSADQEHWVTHGVEFSLHDEDGGTAILEIVRRDELAVDGTVENDKEPCDLPGQLRQKAFFVSFPSSLDGQAGSLRFADNAVVQLFPESATQVHSADCWDEVGSWAGVSGTFEGRSGSYRRVSDSLQTRLVLTES